MLGSPERSQLARLRWRSTVLFALAITTSLIVLAVFASVIDTQSHARETNRELVNIAAQLAGDARSSSIGPAFNPKGVHSWDTVAGTFAFVDDRGIEVASPTQAALPSSSIIGDLVSRAQSSTSPVSIDAPTVAKSLPFHWVALSVPYTTTVVLAGASAVPTAAHHDLDLQLALIVLVLTVLASGLGHVLSGLAMRPAIRGIEQHEQFLREAAHELRTPLAVLQLAASELPESVSNDSPIPEQVERMSALVSRLLDRARLQGADASSIVLEPLRLDQVVELAVEELPGAEDVVLELQPVVVEGHRDLLAQAIRNLVENALIHGLPPVTVIVRDAEVTVVDHGPGVATGSRRRLLKGGRSTGLGTGTGITIVSWVAAIHSARFDLGKQSAHGVRVSLKFASNQRQPRS